MGIMSSIPLAQNYGLPHSSQGKSAKENRREIQEALAAFNKGFE
jgi:hypothetical protein